MFFMTTNQKSLTNSFNKTNIWPTTMNNYILLVKKQKNQNKASNYLSTYMFDIQT